MVDRPMIFSAPMIRALREGRKFQTRLLLGRLQVFGLVTEFGHSDTRGYEWHFRDRRMCWNDLTNATLMQVLPWAIGDRIWVRESGSILAFPDEHDPISRTDRWKTVGWKFDNGVIVGFAGNTPDEYIGDCSEKKQSSIHMPRWASRITLTVTDARVQRLRDISEADAIAEGAPYEDGPDFPVQKSPPGATFIEDGWDCAKDWYADLWDYLYGDGAWARNPWVTALSFTVALANIDAVPKPEAA